MQQIVLVTKQETRSADVVFLLKMTTSAWQRSLVQPGETRAMKIGYGIKTDHRKRTFVSDCVARHGFSNSRVQDARKSLAVGMHSEDCDNTRKVPAKLTKIELNPCVKPIANGSKFAFSANHWN